MSGIKGVLALVALLGLGAWVRNRQKNKSLYQTIESNWKDVRKKLPSDWSNLAPRKQKQARQMINKIHKATGESRRRIRRTLNGLTA